MDNLKHARILVNGLVQGVGFRYYVMSRASKLGLKGYTKNLFSGEVIVEVEGEEGLILELFKEIRIGPRNAQVNSCSVEWSEWMGTYNKFEIRY